MPGRKLLPHSAGPTTGLPGHSTTKPGRFWFSLPRPYKSHDPIAGRTGCVSPDVIMSSDGSWLGVLVCIDRRTHRSSAHSARGGNSSLTSTPDRPQRRNLYGDFSRLVELRSMAMVAGGF